VDPPSIDDAVLEGVRSARPDALEAVYRTYVGPLIGWVRSQGEDHATAEEVVEETFFDLVRGCRRIDGDGPALRAWLYQATRRNLIDHHRSRGRDRSTPTATLPEAASDTPSVEDQVAALSLDPAIVAALDRLTPLQREAVTLHYLADLSIAEVARVTGRSSVAVRQLLHTGRRTLARRLDHRPTRVEVRA
jgi:RNA polymerase sigma-70 factor, ECF subfamily